MHGRAAGMHGRKAVQSDKQTDLMPGRHKSKNGIPVIGHAGTPEPPIPFFIRLP
jgi:hypothetical protein